MKKTNINLDLFAGILISFGLGILILAFIDRSQGILTHSEFGEYTGGGVATLFTLAGIFLFIQALKVQREELHAAILSRDEANVQSEIQSKISLLNGRIQAYSILLEAKTITKTSNPEIINKYAHEVEVLEAELNKVMFEIKKG